MDRQGLVHAATLDLDPPLGPGQSGRDRLIQHIPQPPVPQIEAHLPILKHTQIQKIIQQPRQSQRFIMNNRRIARIFNRPQPVRIPQDLGKRPDRSHWRPQLVAHLAQKRIFLERDLRELLIGLAQLTRGADQFRRFRLELA